MPTTVQRWFQLIRGDVENLRSGVNNLSHADPLYVLQATDDIILSAGVLRTKAIREARGQGATWDEIGQALGITRQAAWEKFHSVVGEEGVGAVS
jgi:hypothetical protein